MDESKPLFVQIAEQVEDALVDGSFPEDGKAPSTNELASFHRINPATAAKGINLLVDKGILYKRRGIGMFVAPGARELVLAERRAAFADRYVRPLITEARTLGLGPDDVISLIHTAAYDTAHKPAPHSNQPG
ncbi:GntR family transcriptional regulator [Dietzia sp.]|uniref:GntR family transcriptional regulator n=1 Tax=Dietzia sp. TaxID=1871616 RepID=UPI002FDB143C